MSVEKRTNGDGTRSWRVRWREGGRNRARTFRTRRDAELFEADLVRRRRLGTLSRRARLISSPPPSSLSARVIALRPAPAFTRSACHAATRWAFSPTPWSLSMCRSTLRALYGP